MALQGPGQHQGTRGVILWPATPDACSYVVFHVLCAREIAGADSIAVVKLGDPRIPQVLGIALAILNIIAQRNLRSPGEAIIVAVSDEHLHLAAVAVGAAQAARINTAAEKILLSQ